MQCRGPRPRPGEDLPNDCKIYVGNLSPVIDDQALREIFAPFGNVLHAAAVIDPMTKQSRGFGFVHMDNPTSAATAVRGMHNQVCLRNIRMHSLYNTISHCFHEIHKFASAVLEEVTTSPIFSNTLTVTDQAEPFLMIAI